MSNIISKDFAELTPWELHAILKARCDVFIVEQNCVCNDIDGTDPICRHLFTLNDKGECTSCLRIYPKPDEPNIFRIGRVVTTERGKGIYRGRFSSCTDEKAAVSDELTAFLQNSLTSRITCGIL